jgi:hypothetical protein
MKNMDEILQSVILFSPTPVFLTAAYAVLVFKKLKGELRIFAWFVFVSAIVQAVVYVLWYYSQNNLPLYPFYIVSGYGCLAWFYGEVMKGFINPKIIWGSAIGLALFTIVNAFFFQGIFTFPSNALTAESVLVIILSLSTFSFLLEDVIKKKKAHLVKSLNWINSGLFIYYTSSLLIFYFADVLATSSSSINRYTWTLHTFFLIVMHSCFFVGLWKRPSN